MQIGDLTLETVAPNAERLLSSTGLSVVEMRSILSGPVMEHLLARAINACLEQGLEIALLAQAIAEEGVESVKAEVVKLYSETESKKASKRGRKV